MTYHIWVNQKQISKNHKAACDEYEKRLSAYCKTVVHVKKSASTPISNLSQKGCIAYRIIPSTHTCSSEELSENINQMSLSGISQVHYYIGYEDSAVASLNSLSLTAQDLSNDTLSVLLLEQLYRGYRILLNQPYHK